MSLGDFVYNPANLFYFMQSSLFCERAQIHTCLDEYETQTGIKDQNNTLPEFGDQNDTPAQV
jgi:hypothetical protein